MNQIILVGKILEEPSLKSTSQGITFTSLQIEVDRSMRSGEGNVCDVFQATMWRSLAEHCFENCKEGQIVGIKGRLQSHTFTKQDGQSFINYEIVGEKVSILS
ncbi:MAG: single-stranded DNA-binding protein [Erysipelotrichaceae bacterium]